MAASILCLIHCIALPLLFSTVPLWGIEILENSWLELGTILVSLFIGGIAIWRGFINYHRKVLVPLLFLSGMGLMIAGNFFTAEWFEMVAKLSGATAMILTHTINWKRIRKIKTHPHHT
jgi:hypothetical protein